ncbi:MAG: TonB-dependent receptor plug domain-containing protein [Acidobacteriota bacterium]
MRPRSCTSSWLVLSMLVAGVPPAALALPGTPPTPSAAPSAGSNNAPTGPADPEPLSSQRQQEKEKAEGKQVKEQKLRYQEQVTVTADRITESLQEVASSVTVITAEQIEASGAQWLIDVLDRAPGVTTVRGGPVGAVSSVFLRGTNSNHTLFLVNGVKVNSPSTGAYNLAHLPASQVERIEIVRGPQSALYGSEALGGVINVITRKGTGPVSGGIEGEGGSFGTGQVQAWVGGSRGELDYSASVARYDSNGFSAADEARGNVENDGYENLSVDSRLGYRSASGWQIEGFLRAFDATTQIDDFAFGVGPVDDGNFVEDSNEIYTAVRLGRQVGRWNTSLTVSDSEIDLTDSNPDASFSRLFGLDAFIREIDWQNEVALAAGNTLIGGVEYRREKAAVESETVFDTSGFNDDVDVTGLYLHDRMLLAGDRVTLSFGGRHENHSVFGGHTTGQVGASVRLPLGLRVHGSLGTGFRAPSINDLFFPFFGNRALGPEKSTGGDIGVQGYWDESGLRFDLTYFRNDITDLIQFSLATFQAENIGNALTQGVEASGEWAPSDRFGLGGTYTFTDAMDQDLDLPLLRRPRHQGSLRLTVRPSGRLRVFTEVRAKGHRQDFGPVGRVDLGGFLVWNAAAEFNFNPEVSIITRLDNLLDKEYQEVFGFGSPERSGFVGLRLRLGGR